MSKLLSNQAYLEILEIVGKWKIVDIKTVQSDLKYKWKYDAVRKKIQYLVNQNLLHYKTLYKGKKYFYLSEIGLSFTNYTRTFMPIEDSLTHDLICFDVVREFLKFKNIIDGGLEYKEHYNTIPDGYICGLNNNNLFTFALELELTQKSKKRVQEKFLNYYHSDFNYVLYITNKKAVYYKYQDYLTEMNTEIQKKIIFYLDTSIRVKSAKINKESTLKFKSQDIKIEDFFGVKKENYLPEYYGLSENLPAEKPP